MLSTPKQVFLEAWLNLFNHLGYLAGGLLVICSSCQELELRSAEFGAGCVVRETTFGEYSAVVPEVEGSAYITEFLIAADDPLREGFILR